MKKNSYKKTAPKSFLMEQPLFLIFSLIDILHKQL